MPIVAHTVRWSQLVWIGKLAINNVPFIGANHRMIRCRDFVVRELITPRIHRMAIDRTTVCNEVLESRSAASKHTDMG